MVATLSPRLRAHDSSRHGFSAVRVTLAPLFPLVLSDPRLNQPSTSPLLLLLIPFLSLAWAQFVLAVWRLSCLD